MRHLARARNPYSRWWLWIPGSLVSLAPRNDEFEPQHRHQPLHHMDRSLRGEMRVIPRQRDAAVDRDRTLPRRADRIDHGEVGELVMRRQRRLHLLVERE